MICSKSNKLLIEILTWNIVFHIKGINQDVFKTRSLLRKKLRKSPQKLARLHNLNRLQISKLRLLTWRPFPFPINATFPNLYLGSLDLHPIANGCNGFGPNRRTPTTTSPIPTYQGIERKQLNTGYSAWITKGQVWDHKVLQKLKFLGWARLNCYG